MNDYKNIYKYKNIFINTIQDIYKIFLLNKIIKFLTCII